MKLVIDETTTQFLVLVKPPSYIFWKTAHIVQAYDKWQLRNRGWSQEQIDGLKPFMIYEGQALYTNIKVLEKKYDIHPIEPGPEPDYS